MNLVLDLGCFGPGDMGFHQTRQGVVTKSGSLVGFGSAECRIPRLKMVVEQTDLSSRRQTRWMTVKGHHHPGRSEAVEHFGLPKKCWALYLVMARNFHQAEKCRGSSLIHWMRVDCQQHCNHSGRPYKLDLKHHPYQQVKDPVVDRSENLDWDSELGVG